ncbi:MAG TPA: hypothetical protein VFZ00_28370 [Solirubrobacter sp.]|nr:hypothetical protein [Solirubrobacter sp.]
MDPYLTTERASARAVRIPVRRAEPVARDPWEPPFTVTPLDRAHSYVLHQQLIREAAAARRSARA